MWGHSSLTKDQTHTPCNGSTESQPLDCQGSPNKNLNGEKSIFTCHLSNVLRALYCPMSSSVLPHKMNSLHIFCEYRIFFLNPLWSFSQEINVKEAREKERRLPRGGVSEPVLEEDLELSRWGPAGRGRLGDGRARSRKSRVPNLERGWAQEQPGLERNICHLFQWTRASLFSAFASEKQLMMFVYRGWWKVMTIAGSKSFHKLGVMAHAGLGIRWTMCGHFASIGSLGRLWNISGWQGCHHKAFVVFFSCFLHHSPLSSSQKKFSPLSHEKMVSFISLKTWIPP